MTPFRARRRFPNWLPLLASSFLILACTETPAEPDPPELTSLTVTVSAPTVMVGQAVTATATGTDQNGAPIATGNVAWTASSEVSIDATGRVTGVSAGQATITATSAGKSGQATVTVTALPASALSILTPPSPTAPNRVRFTQQPVVQVVNANGGAVSQAGVVVTATASTGGTLTAATATTDATGKATFTDLMLSGSAGNYTLTFAAPGLGSQTASVALTAGAAALVQMGAGNQQQAVSGTAVAIAPSVRVVDADGNPVSGVTVIFDVSQGGGTVTGSPAVTNANGDAQLTQWTLGTTGANALLAHLAGNPFGVTISATATQPPPVLTTLVVSLAPASIVAGARAQATVVGRDQYGATIATGAVTWSANGPVTISASGLVQGVSAGQATIIATAGGKTGQTTLTVTAQPVLTTLAVSIASPSIQVGGTTQASVAGKDQFGADIAVGAVTWTTTGGASVSATGLVTGTVAGPATVRAAAGSVSAQAALTVTAAPAPSAVLTTLFIQITPPAIVVGGTAQAIVSGADQFGLPIATGPVVWSATGGVTISPSGAIMGTTAGSATITATAGNVSAQASVTVTPVAQVPVLTTISVSVAPTTVPVGGQAQATAVGRDQFGNAISIGAVVWSTTANATINSTGLVTGASAGSATITAALGNVSGQATLTVTPSAPAPVLSAIYVTVTPATITVGGNAQALAEGRDQNGNPMSISGLLTWTATPEVTINNAGVTTGVSIGQATITASAGGKSGNQTVTVSGAPYLNVLTVTVNPTTIGIGEFSQATATGKDQYGNPIALGRVDWYSSLGAVIDQTGRVVGTATGITVISASTSGAQGIRTAQTNITIADATPTRRLLVNAPPTITIPNRNTFPVTPVVQVVNDADGQPIMLAGIPITVSLTRGLGTLIGGPTTVMTDANGRATFVGLAPAMPQGAGYTIDFTAPDSKSARWTFNVGPGSVPTGIIISSGNNQTAPSGRLLPDPPLARVVDPEGNGVNGVTVNFVVTAGGGTIEHASVVSGSSVNNGFADGGNWRMGSVGTNTLTASAAGLGTVTFTATAGAALVCAPPQTMVIGQGSFGRLVATGCTLNSFGNPSRPFTGPEVDGTYLYDHFVLDIPAGAVVRFDATYDFNSAPGLQVYDATGTYIASKSAGANPPLSVTNSTGQTQRYQLLLVSHPGSLGGRGYYSITPVRTN